MALNTVLVDIQTYQETQDAFALLHLIKIAEKDIQNGDFESSEKVFSDLRKKIFEQYEIKKMIETRTEKYNPKNNISWEKIKEEI